MKRAKTRMLGLLIMSIMISVILSSVTIVGYAESPTGNERQTVVDENGSENDKSQVIFSYKDVFKGYYDKAIELAAEQNKAVTCTYDEFCDNYYTSGMDLTEYTQAVALGGEAAGLEPPQTTESQINPMSSSSADADYILSKDTYSYTPAGVFKRAPKYSLFDYSFLRKGDVVNEYITILNNIGHTAIISDTNKSGAYGNYIETIESVGGGVQYGFLDDVRMVNFGVEIGRFFRVSVTNEQYDSIISFCKAQLGKPYSFDPSRTNTSINSDKWYCSELIYAAYYSEGLPLCSINAQGGVMPADIVGGQMIRSELYYKNLVLRLSVVSKSGSKWTINVNHYLGGNIEVFYNTKMCNKNDAINWTGLKDVNSVTVPSGTGANVVIAENWFAGYITFSYVSEGVRCITYANELNKNNKTLSEKYNII